MSKRQILVLLGVWVGVFLFLGLPSGWLDALGVVTGVVLIALAYSLGSEPSRTNTTDNTYVEHKSTENKSEVVVSDHIFHADSSAGLPSEPTIDNSTI